MSPHAPPFCSCENAEPPCTDRLAPPSSCWYFHSSATTRDSSIVVACEGVGRALDASSCFLASRGALLPLALARSLAARAALSAPRSGSGPPPRRGGCGGRRPPPHSRHLSHHRQRPRSCASAARAARNRGSDRTARRGGAVRQRSASRASPSVRSLRVQFGPAAAYVSRTVPHRSLVSWFVRPAGRRTRTETSRVPTSPIRDHRTR